ncbi:hypothetical protein ACTPOK_10345 [Streptomyces inhibens]|uniref:hypothetical protein n=1 Tax=Streptomyces inhibens TaxID=2293571 RepID=UPI00402ACF26
MHPSPHTPTPAPSVLALPPAFEAFYAMQRAPYLAYAQAHLPPRLAATVVSETFATLVNNWHSLVGSINPTADAWDHLSHQVRQRATRLPLTADLRYDALVLAALGYTPTDSADITGRDPSKIRYLTRTATARLRLDSAKLRRRRRHTLIAGLYAGVQAARTDPSWHTSSALTAGPVGQISLRTRRFLVPAVRRGRSPIAGPSG